MLPLHRGVYRWGPVVGRYAREMAATLACGPEAAVSHASAAALWALARPPKEEAPVEVRAPRTVRIGRCGIRVYRGTPLPRGEIRRLHGVRVTSPARTILDLAPRLGPRDAERMLARGERERIVSVEAVRTLVARHPRLAGAAVLRAILAETSGLVLTRSEAEERFLSLIRRGGIPNPKVNVTVEGFEVDFLWQDAGLVAEVDGFTYHGDRVAFNRDRDRDARLVAAGLRVIRFTWRNITQEPEAVLVRLARALAAGPGGDVHGRPPRQT